MVFARALAERDAEDYEAFVARARGGHYSQTQAWARSFGKTLWRTPWFFLARERGAVVGAAVVLVPRARVVGLSERGPVVDATEALAGVLSGLAAASRAHGIFRLGVMPYWAGDDAVRAEEALRGAGFRDVQTPDGAHAASLRWPLDTPSEDALLEGPSRKKLRHELRHAERSGVRVRSAGVSDTPNLVALDDALARAQGRRPRGAEWFARMHAYLAAGASRGALFLAEQDDAPLAWVLVLRHGELAVYVAGASDPAPRPFSKMAQAVFAAACWARKEGARSFNLGGVPMDGDSDAKRAAIARFKHDFTKDRVRLVRAHARWGWPSPDG